MLGNALIVVDMVKSFFVPSPRIPVPTNIDALLQANRKLVKKARAAGIPVLFSNDNFQKTEAPIDRHFKLFGPHALWGTEAAQIVDELEYDEQRDFLAPKKRYDGFFDTRLDSILRELKVSTCTISGTWTNACVQHTVMGAWCRSYDVVIPADCCACPSEEEHHYALRYMERFYGADIIDLDTWTVRLDEGQSLYQGVYAASAK